MGYDATLSIIRTMVRFATQMHVEWVGDEAVALNQRTKELHYLNPQSALLYALLLEYGMPGAVDEAEKRLPIHGDDLRAEIDQLLLTFLAKGLLTEVPPDQPSQS